MLVNRGTNRDLAYWFCVLEAPHSDVGLHQSRWVTGQGPSHTSPASSVSRYLGIQPKSMTKQEALKPLQEDSCV